MTWKHLKILRIVVSMLTIVPLCLIYLDIANQLPAWYTSFWTSFQFIPSVLKAFVYTGAATIGLYFVLLLTMLFGRVYCSGICPLGTYQDILIRISKMVRRRRWFAFRTPAYAIHYGVLAVIVVSVLSGSVLLLNMLEPFSTFGRIVNSLIRPIIIGLNNVLAMELTGFDIFIIFPAQYYPIAFTVLGSIIFFTAVVTILSWFYGRLFCNLLCPAGAALGILSRFSFFKMEINESSCTQCKLCEKVCKANCINSETQSIDFAACVGCFNCMDACHTDGVIYTPRWSFKSEANTQPAIESRRSMLRSTTVMVMSTIIPIIDTARTITASGFDESRKHPITPPGSNSFDRFSSLCTACQLCVTSCPTHVLQPAFLEYGIAGILQPKMDYTTSYCNYDCTICTEICPSGALLPLLPDVKKLTQLGKAIFFKEDCIVITKKKDCGACSEHCPTKAVNMVPHEGIFLPEVNEKICTGCGACEHACPTTPRKAIYVEANPFHLTAEKPKIKKSLKIEQPMEEFPF